MASPTTTNKTTAHRKAAMRVNGLERIANVLRSQRGLITDHDYRMFSVDLAVKLDTAHRDLAHHEQLAESAALA